MRVCVYRHAIKQVYSEMLMIASRWPETYCVVYLKIFIIKCLEEKVRGKCAFHSMSTELLTRS